MSIKAGRVGVNPADVNPVNGKIDPSAVDVYTKEEADAKLNHMTGYTSQKKTVNGLVLECTRIGHLVILTVSDGTPTEAIAQNGNICSTTDFDELFGSTEYFVIVTETLENYGKTARIYTDLKNVKTRSALNTSNPVRFTLIAVV